MAKHEKFYNPGFILAHSIRAALRQSAWLASPQGALHQYLTRRT